MARTCIGSGEYVPSFQKGFRIQQVPSVFPLTSFFRRSIPSTMLTYSYAGAEFVCISWAKQTSLWTLLSYMPAYIHSCDVIDLIVLCLIGLSEVKILSSSSPIAAWAIFWQWDDELLAQKFLQIAQFFLKKSKRRVVWCTNIGLLMKWKHSYIWIDHMSA